jgi:hypothetical protein
VVAFPSTQQKAGNEREVLCFAMTTAKVIGFRRPSQGKDAEALLPVVLQFAYGQLRFQEIEARFDLHSQRRHFGAKRFLASVIRLLL